jgi:predicted component of type VI protein secretion system
MPPQLMALDEGPNILLDKPILLIGRHQECDIQIPSRKISRRHCCIAQVNDHLVIRDLGSTNGIRVNGIKVNEGQLKSGDEVVIGNFKYEVKFQPAPVAAIAAGPPKQGPPPPALAVPAVPPPPALPAEARSPFDSGDEPIPIAEPNPLAPIRPTNKSQPPTGPQAREDGPDISHGFAESMSLEPPSEDEKK